MFKNILLNISVLLLLINCSLCSKRYKNVENELKQNQRSFLKFIDEEKLISYLTSFGADPSVEEYRKHMVYKRASGRIKKIKKMPFRDNLSEPIKQHKKSSKDLENLQNFKNLTTTPKHMIKFELEDAKYNEEYEKLRNNKKTRAKRSLMIRPKNETIANVKIEKIVSRDTFIQPKEVLKFVYSDAVTISPLESTKEYKKLKDERKSKREVDNTIDSTASNSRKIKIIHPLSTASRTKHVSYDELPLKMKKIVESAITDAISKGKASEGDHLKFYYGDKIIKVPISLSKHITFMKDSPSIGLSGHYNSKATDNTFTKYQSIIKQDSKPLLKENLESYAYFTTPKESSIKSLNDESLKIDQNIPKTSVHFYSSADDSFKNLGPIKFEDAPLKLPENYFFENRHIYSSGFKEIIRDAIPITEDFNENNLNAPKSLPIHPTSYFEYEDNQSDKHTNLYKEDKSYAFGYHVSDYKSGNNFGHTQTKNNKETKGEYSILLPDGRIQITKYFADDSGFHADVTYQNIH